MIAKAKAAAAGGGGSNANVITFDDYILSGKLTYINNFKKSITPTYLLTKGQRVNFSFDYEYSVVAGATSNPATIKLGLGPAFNYVVILSVTTNASTTQAITGSASFSRDFTVTTTQVSATDWSGVVFDGQYGYTNANSYFRFTNIKYTLLD